MMDNQNDKPSNEQLNAALAITMGKLMISNPKIYNALSSGQMDPASAGMGAAHIVTKLREKMIGRGALVSDKIWAAEDGVLTHLLDHMTEIQGGGEEFHNKASKAAIQTLYEYDEASRATKGQPPQE